MASHLSEDLAHYPSLPYTQSTPATQSSMVTNRPATSVQIRPNSIDILLSKFPRPFDPSNSDSKTNVRAFTRSRMHYPPYHHHRQARIIPVEVENANAVASLVVPTESLRSMLSEVARALDQPADVEVTTKKPDVISGARPVREKLKPEAAAVAAAAVAAASSGPRNRRPALPAELFVTQQRLPASPSTVHFASQASPIQWHYCQSFGMSRESVPPIPYPPAALIKLNRRQLRHAPQMTVCDAQAQEHAWTRRIYWRSLCCWLAYWLGADDGDDVEVCAVKCKRCGIRRV